MRILGLLVWFRRLPGWFVLYFAAVMLVILFLFAFVVQPSQIGIISRFLSKWLQVPAFLAERPVIKIGLDGSVFFLLVLLSGIFSYNAAVFLSRRMPRRCRIAVGPPEPVVPGGGKKLEKFRRIGIILAGGGAKGAYQAGAMKAIYEFLEENNGLDKVRMIAGTSIGSWNSMFWLANLVKSASGMLSVHEQWWRSISIPSLVELDYYFPMLTNHFLRSKPWEESFSRLFVNETNVLKHLARLFANGAEVEPPIHFYFTRSNVALGQLEFSTNWTGIRTLTRRGFGACNKIEEKLVVEPERYEVIQGESRIALAKMQRAVFASMDLPPLFHYVPVRIDRTEFFEDGGVVDNLPVWFGTQIEKCDLLFILPLNASFAEPVNHTSIIHRLFRVMDVRQGVLERNSLKLAYLYNELAAAREKMTGDGENRADSLKLENRVRTREHKPVSVFAICPDQPLAIGTAELWKAREAGDAFDLMYASTKYELIQRFEELTDPNWIRMVLVRPEGERVYVDNF